MENLPKNPAAELEAFGSTLGIAQDKWSAREELEQITLVDELIEKEALLKLDWSTVSAIKDAYGGAFSAEFLWGEVTKLVIDEHLSQDDFVRFREDFKRDPTSMTLNLTLNKALLIGRWLQDLPGCKLYLYFYPAALENLLMCSLREMERLWPEARKVILLVQGRDVEIIGPGIVVKGGRYLQGWSHQKDEISLQQPDWNKTDEIRQAHRINLKRDDPRLDFLTPLHLELKKVEPPDDSIAKALMVQLANSFLIYTADATTGPEDDPIMATYAGNNASVDVVLGGHGEGREISLAECNSLLEIFKWAYGESQWVNDRLAFLQVAVVQALKAGGKKARIKSLLENASGIWDGLDWEWKSFIDGKIESYVSGAKDLEDYVDQTTKAYADEISSMIKGLADTMLAAVGVLIGSIIGSLFGKEFSPTIFKVGMWAYAIYVLIFPFLYSMSYQMQRYLELGYGFNLRKESFNKRLLPDKVSLIIGKRVSKSQTRFKWWFVLIGITYLAVIALAIQAADWVPVLMKDNLSLSNLSINQIAISVREIIGSSLVRGGIL